MKLWLSNIEHQDEFEQFVRSNIKKHLIALTRDLNQAKKLYSAGDYFQCGEIVGDMVVIATSP